MKRQFVFGTVMAAALTVGLGAQTPSPQDYPQSSKPQSSSSSQEKRGAETGRGQTVTVTGCLQSGDSSASATGTAGTTSRPSAAAGSTFKLTDVSQSSSDKSGAAGTAGTSGMASIPTSLDLMASGSASSGWSKYLNHKVEVKGTLENSMGSSSSAGAAGANPPSTTPPSTTPPSTTPPANPPSSTSPSSSSMSGTGAGATLHVTSIKEIAATCSGAPK